MKALRTIWSLMVASSLILALAVAPALAGTQSTLDKGAKQERAKQSAKKAGHQAMNEKALMEQSQSFFDSRRTLMSKDQRKQYEAAVLAEIERQNETAALSF